MRVLVCGDRNWTDQELVDCTLDMMHASKPIALIIEGEAQGADKMGRNWAERHDVPFRAFPAQWDRYGRAAGPIRNQQQLNEGHPDLVVAFHDDLAHSKGTRHMVKIAQRANVPVRIITHG